MMLHGPAVLHFHGAPAALLHPGRRFVGRQRTSAFAAKCSWAALGVACRVGRLRCYAERRSAEALRSKVAKAGSPKDCEFAKFKITEGYLKEKPGLSIRWLCFLMRAPIINGLPCNLTASYGQAAEVVAKKDLKSAQRDAPDAIAEFQALQKDPLASWSLLDEGEFQNRVLSVLVVACVPCFILTAKVFPVTGDEGKVILQNVLADLTFGSSLAALLARYFPEACRSELFSLCVAPNRLPCRSCATLPLELS